MNAEDIKAMLGPYCSFEVKAEDSAEGGMTVTLTHKCGTYAGIIIPSKFVLRGRAAVQRIVQQGAEQLYKAVLGDMVEHAKKQDVS